jgi:hypothetical protein
MGAGAVTGTVAGSLKKKEDKWPEHIRKKEGFDQKKCNCCDCLEARTILRQIERLKQLEELDE